MENNLIKYESNLGNFKSNIDISFSASNIIAITGLSGSGKSTIAKVICGLLTVSYTHLTLPTTPYV